MLHILRSRPLPRQWQRAIFVRVSMVHITKVSKCILTMFYRRTIGHLLMLFFHCQMVLVQRTSIHRSVHIASIQCSITSQCLNILIQMNISSLRLLYIIVPITFRLPSKRITTFRNSICRLTTSRMFVQVRKRVLILSVVSNMFLPILVYLLLKPCQKCHARTIQRCVLGNHFLTVLLRSRLDIRISVLIP